MPAGSHAPIVYPAALLAEAKPGAIALMMFLDGEHTGRIFADAGFTRP
jgi:molybdate transport system substrate-binding protein